MRETRRRYRQEARSRRKAAVGSIAGGLCCLLLVSLGRAQQAPQSLISTGDAQTLQDLAKDTLNPFARAFKVPFQFTTGFGIGAHHGVGESLNIEPLLPFELNADWDLIARPSLNLTYTSGPAAQFGFQDLQTSFFITPAREKAWIWGLGPIFQFPTASSKGFGTGRWSVGPTAALVYDKGAWFGAILTYQLMSFAGDRDRGSVNQTYLEPQVSYSFQSGWYGDYDPSITYDWTADTANAWTLPVGVDVGKALRIEGRSMSLQVGAYGYPMHPSGSPQWIARTELTLLFPRE